MAKYFKIAKVVEADQYLHGKFAKGMCSSKECQSHGHNKPHVHTIHNNQIVNVEVGDYIIPEPDGEHFYPVKPDIFNSTYESAEEYDTNDIRWERLKTDRFVDKSNVLEKENTQLLKAMQDIYELFPDPDKVRLPISQQVLEIVKRFVK